VARLLFHLLPAEHQFLGLLEEYSALIGERRGRATPALEQVVAQMAFERADLVADGRLAHAETFCGAAEIAITGSRNKDFQLSERDRHGKESIEVT
jgi:hypothetical protein